VKGQPEKISLEPYSKLTATDGRRAKVKRQWVPDNWSSDEKALPTEPSRSGSWNKQITLGRAETRTARIVSDCTGNAAEVGRPGDQRQSCFIWHLKINSSNYEHCWCCWYCCCCCCCCCYFDYCL